jgi:hypothetical protein
LACKYTIRQPIGEMIGVASGDEDLLSIPLLRARTHIRSRHHASWHESLGLSGICSTLESSKQIKSKSQLSETIKA